jgi:hypothetical protein
MSMQLPDLFVRFYGRFIFAETPGAPGGLRAIAIDPGWNADIPADAHHLFLTLSEGQIAMPIGRRPANFRKASYRVMANVDPFHASHLLWTLRRQYVDIPSGGGVTWSPGAKERVADMNALGSGQILNGDYLRHVHGPVTSIISLNGGIATAFQMTTMPLRYEYVAFGQPTVVSKDAGLLADMVQVQLPFPQDGLTLTTIDESGSTSTISIPTPTAPPTVPVIITFSNVCSTSHEGADFEFAGFYEIFDPPPVLPTRLIPRMTTVHTRPFGDCFLASRVVY